MTSSCFLRSFKSFFAFFLWVKRSAWIFLVYSSLSFSSSFYFSPPSTSLLFISLSISSSFIFSACSWASFYSLSCNAYAILALSFSITCFSSFNCMSSSIFCYKSRSLTSFSYLALSSSSSVRILTFFPWPSSFAKSVSTLSSMCETVFWVLICVCMFVMAVLICWAVAPDYCICLSMSFSCWISV